jgi:hypothetical protein
MQSRQCRFSMMTSKDSLRLQSQSIYQNPVACPYFERACKFMFLNRLMPVLLISAQASYAKQPMASSNRSCCPLSAMPAHLRSFARLSLF